MGETGDMYSGQIQYGQDRDWVISGEGAYFNKDNGYFFEGSMEDGAPKGDGTLIRDQGADAVLHGAWDNTKLIKPFDDEYHQVK